MGKALPSVRTRKTIFRTCLPILHISKSSIIILIIAAQFAGIASGSETKSLQSSFLNLYQAAIQEKNEGNYQNAINLLRNYLSLTKDNGESKLNGLLNLAVLYWNAGDITGSKKYYSKAAELSNKLGLKERKQFSLFAKKIIDLYQEGKACRLNGKYDRSIQLFSEAISLSKEIKSPEHELKCTRLMSLTYWELDDLKQFFLLNSRALELAEMLKHNKERGKCLNNIGAYYSRLDNISAALTAYEKALLIAKKEESAEDTAIALLNIGGIWSDLGNYEKSLEYLKQALEIDEKLSDKSSIAKDLNNIGIALRLKGLSNENKEDFNRAEEIFQQSLAIAKAEADKTVTVQVLNNLGSIYADLDRSTQALECFRSAARIAENANDFSYLGMVYNNIGIVYSSLGNFEESTKNYEKALSLDFLFKNGTFIWETFYELGNTHKKQNDYVRALNDYKNAIASIESIRSRITNENLKASYLGTDKRIEVYQNLIDLLVTLHKTDPAKGYDKEAFNYLERGKARAFLDSLEVAELDVSQGINPVLANREKEAMRDISKAYSKLLATDVSPEDKEIISGQIKSLEDQLDLLKREIRMVSPAYADLRYPKVITYDEVRKELLAPHEAYFAYSLGKEASYAFVVLHDGLRIFKLPPRKVIQQQVIEYRKAISDRQNQDFHLGQELYQELVFPGIEPGIKDIVFIPDDILNLLPFETLLTNHEPRSWLIREFQVGYVPSLSSLRILRQRQQNGSRPHKDLLAIGDAVYNMGQEGSAVGPALDILYGSGFSPSVPLSPLKYSAAEIKNISQLFPANRVTVLEKQEATERWLKSNPLTDYRIIHFATHSLIDDKKPARSAILLSYNEGKAGEGLLQARDIYNLKMNAELVTLSACQTGLGQFIRGEGIEGLSRAFFYAGASSVLMSLWAVNDQATSLLMEGFYRHLRGSESLMGALRNAKLEMIGSRTLSHPYYWAGFVINGKADSEVYAGSRNLMMMLASALGINIILVLAVTIRRHKKTRIHG